MNLHEYQAKAVLRDYGISTPRGVVVSGADQCAAAVAELGGTAWVAKAQIHAGGRGKAGGVKLVRSVEDLAAAAGALLGSRLTTYQNAPDGQPVHASCSSRKPCPSPGNSISPSPWTGPPSASASWLPPPAAWRSRKWPAASPEKILKEWVNPVTGFMDYQGRNLAFGLGLEGEQIGAFVKMAKTLYKVFLEKDLALLEINPLIVTTDGKLLPLDCKMGVEDNALYRQKALAAIADETQIDPKEAEAHAHEVNYIALNGNIGCMVNGAGLAMATMDLIKLSGGMPANFLDVGGGATAATVAQAFKIILSDPKVKAVLINIFGGIMRCDVIARGSSTR
jgi:succinyl-CoA synthetase beta subunit